jgi:hypothetical protein
VTFFAMIVVLAFIVAAAYSVTTIVRLTAQWSLRRHGQGANTAALEERLARLEASIEGLGAETQRLTEGHRFFTQLLTNRPPSALPTARSTDAAGKNGTT